LIELAPECDEVTLFGAVLRAGVDANARTRGGLTAFQNPTIHGCDALLLMLKQAGVAK
jgi:hypothetical protein